MNKEKKMMEFTEEKKNVICPYCGSGKVELSFAHYYIRVAVFFCNNCKKYFEKHFEIKGDKNGVFRAS